jgi:hypothetical protein
MMRVRVSSKGQVVRLLLRSISGQPANRGRAFEGSRDAPTGSHTIRLTKMSVAIRGWLVAIRGWL